APRDQHQFMAVTREHACERNSDSGGSPGDDGNGPRVRHVFTLPARPSFAPIQRSAADPLFEVFARWEVAREHRLLDKLLWIESPELAHLRVGLDDGVGELSVDRRHLANVDVEYRRAVFIEPHRPDRAMSETDAVHRLEEGSRIVGL